MCNDNFDAVRGCASSKYILLIALSAAMFLATGSTPAHAQGISVGPAPGTTQTFSPYLGLLRSGGGILPNYQQFVRPRLQLQDTLNRQQQALKLQANELQATQRRVSTLRDPSGLTTGVRSGFLQYSTFYPGLQPGGGAPLRRR